ncbi:hypothetical protein CALCODRAFT_205360 [Calocera cornea HHB12733]|uniref:Uncharacterized protein n=1 Tax=Calocera cornea HHB12733 TaxID=1353952 RepID=A0A165K0Q6_9BASI|nr:hypothetical protein CALCODRAFT_205360 [Calocera cornea HHB12733]
MDRVKMARVRGTPTDGFQDPRRRFRKPPPQSNARTSTSIVISDYADTKPTYAHELHIYSEGGIQFIRRWRRGGSRRKAAKMDINASPAITGRSHSLSHLTISCPADHPNPYICIPESLHMHYILKGVYDHLDAEDIRQSAGPPVTRPGMQQKHRSISVGLGGTTTSSTSLFLNHRLV